MKTEIIITEDELCMIKDEKTFVVDLSYGDYMVDLKNKLKFPDAFLKNDKIPSKRWLKNFEYAEFTIEDFIRDLIRVGNIHPALKLWAISVIMEA
jgi:hypothetical protein